MLGVCYADQAFLTIQLLVAGLPIPFRWSIPTTDQQLFEWISPNRGSSKTQTRLEKSSQTYSNMCLKSGLWYLHLMKRPQIFGPFSVDLGRWSTVQFSGGSTAELANANGYIIPQNPFVWHPQRLRNPSKNLLNPTSWFYHVLYPYTHTHIYIYIHTYISIHIFIYIYICVYVYM